MRLKKLTEKQIKMIKSKYFCEKEFNNCYPAASLQQMDQNFINRLDLARNIAAIPIVINCAYRSVAWEKQQGRRGTSAHTLGCAVDIRCNTSRNRIIVVNALLKAGFTRIGVAKSFIHVDNSKKHDENVLWVY